MNGKIYLLMRENEEDIANMKTRINVSYVLYFNKNIKGLDLYLRIGM